MYRPAYLPACHDIFYRVWPSRHAPIKVFLMEALGFGVARSDRLAWNFHLAEMAVFAWEKPQEADGLPPWPEPGNSPIPAVKATDPRSPHPAGPISLLDYLQFARLARCQGRSYPEGFLG